MQRILFEVNKETCMLSSDTMVIRDSFEYQNWYRNEQDYLLLYAFKDGDKAYRGLIDLMLDNNGIEIETLDDFTPVGSIEFVEHFLGKQINAINIPNKLNKKKYTGRNTLTVGKEVFDSAYKLIEMKLGKGVRVFIKDAEHCKKFDPIIYKDRDSETDLPDKLFISEEVDIRSEFRAFVFRNKILDCRQYLGEFTDTYDKELLADMVREWTDSPTAYTLDIGVLENGETVIIEAHNFIACGLYGFEAASKLPSMTTIAFKEEKYNRKVGGGVEKEG